VGTPRPRGLNGAGWTASKSGAELHGKRSLTAAIDEWISRDGRVLRPLDADEVRREIALLAAAGVEAIAVCFLHSRRHPAHERAMAALAGREFPGIAASLSAEVVPEPRQYERATTTLANAFVSH